MDKLKFYRPEILTHPNIPKPLHGVNPRSIKGQGWWDIKRRAAYAENNFHCWACGIHKDSALYRTWLEGHENYDIDYISGRVELVEITALCHPCHMFIHSGRLLSVYRKGEYGWNRARAILERGIGILERHGLEPYYAAILAWNEIVLRMSPRDAMDEIRAKGLIPDREEEMAVWSDWHLVLDGEDHYTPYANVEEWKKKYQKA